MFSRKDTAEINISKAWGKGVVYWHKGGGRGGGHPGEIDVRVDYNGVYLKAHVQQKISRPEELAQIQMRRYRPIWPYPKVVDRTTLYVWAHRARIRPVATGGGEGGLSPPPWKNLSPP